MSILIKLLTSNTLNKSVVTSVFNYTNKLGKPAKYIESDLGHLDLHIRKNKDGPTSLEIWGGTALKSIRHRIFRGTIDADFSLAALAIKLIGSDDSSEHYRGHAIAVALLGEEYNQY